MTRILTISLTVVCLAICVNGDCFHHLSCIDTTTNIEYEDRQRWKSASKPCYTCQCVVTNFTVLTCKVGTDRNLVTEENLGKVKPVFADAQSRRRRSAQNSERVEITEDEVDTIECPPTPSPVFNMETMELEDVSYKWIQYYVTRKFTSCCRRYMTYTRRRDIPEGCKIIHPISGNRCYEKAVQVDNPDLPCDRGPLSMVG